MCGIVGFTGKEPAFPILFDGLEALEYRGYDSSGIATLSEGKLRCVKTKGRVAELEKKSGGGTLLPGNAGIGHTRWATHGAPADKNAHPILSYGGTFAVVHNGIIENYAAIKADLEKDGVQFLSETDTEAVAHLLEREYSQTHDVLSALSRVIKQLRGSFALGIITPLYPVSIFAARKDSPLIVGAGDGFNMIASDVPALKNRTSKVVIPGDGDIIKIDPDGIKIYDYDLNERFCETVFVEKTDCDAGKDGFPHYMLKEIYQQPEAVARVFSKTDEIARAADFIASACGNPPRKIDIVGCGSAYHAGLGGKYFIESVSRIPVEVHSAGEYRYRDALTGKEVLTIVISQSGETADSLAALREAKRKGSPVLGIVNARLSSIARESDAAFFTDAGPEIAVATTKGYLTQLAALFALGTELGEGRLRKEYFARIFDEIPDKIRSVIRMSQRVFDISKYVASREHAYFIGRLSDYATACEGALKLKEISYIHAEAYAAAELKHGTISLISEGVPVIAVSSDPLLENKMLAGIKEIKARGGTVFAVAGSECAHWEKECDALIRVPGCDSRISGLIITPVLQLLGYHAAQIRGCDIDKPRNLAKSVTVE